VQKYCTHGGRVSHLSTFLTRCSGTLITENSLRSCFQRSTFKPRTHAISAPSASRQQSRLRRQSSAWTAVNLRLFRAFRPLAGFHSSGLNSVFASRQKHPIAIGTTKVISAPLFSCSGAFTHASRRGHRRFRGTKNPRASNWRSRDYVTNLGPAGLSLLSPDRLLSLLDVCGCRFSRCSEYLYVRLARTVPHSTVHYSQARASVSNAERPATGLALHGWPLARVRTRP